MTTFTNKMVAVMNENIESGKIMNALAHMCVGYGAMLGTEKLELMDYQDADNGTHPYISKMPFIVLKANSNKIRQLRQTAIEQNIFFTDFTDAMTVGTYLEQQQRSLQTKEQDFTYYGIVLFGAWEQISVMTKKFSLWK